MTTSTSTWAAPCADRPIRAEVVVPGSKSMTNRALLLGALADEPTVVSRPLRSRDTLLMAEALRSLGVVIEDVTGGCAPDRPWRIVPGRITGNATVDCGLAGTVMRFVPAVAALADGPVTFDGDARARVRPMSPALQALRALGVTVTDDGRGALPFTVHGTGRVRGGEVTIDASSSSQFVSGLLLAAPRFDEGVVVRHVGPPVPSTPHLEMTVEMLRAAGAEVSDPRSSGEPDVWRVAPGPLRGGAVDVEPDLTNAAPFLAAAAVTGGFVGVVGWPTHTTQAGDALRDLLARMGAEVRPTGTALTVAGPASAAEAPRGGPIPGLRGIDADLRAVGELAPVLAALAALASTPSHLHGIGHLRGHETDRLAALRTELTRLGGDVEETVDGLVIRPRPLHGGFMRTYDDHRMVMAGAVLALAVPGVVVDDPGTVGKTLPQFVPLWERMLAGAAVGR